MNYGCQRGAGEKDRTGQDRTHAEEGGVSPGGYEQTVGDVVLGVKDGAVGALNAILGGDKGSESGERQQQPGLHGVGNVEMI